MTAEIVSIVPTPPEDCPCTREAVWEINYGALEACPICGAWAEEHEAAHPEWTLLQFRRMRASEWGL